jgi:hypothetical protein
MAALQDIVAVPEPPLTVMGVIIPQVRPLGTISVRLTFPLKPLREAIVIVVVADTEARTGAGDEAAIVKSWKLKIAVVEWLREPFVPEIVRV